MPDYKTRLALGIATTSIVLGLLEVQGAGILTAKILAGIALIAYILYITNLQFLEKNYKITVSDVKPGRRDAYREDLIKKVGQLGDVVSDKYERTSNTEFIVKLTSRRSVEELEKQIRVMKTKFQLKAVDVNLSYESLEAEATMKVKITGTATPGSRVYIEGLSTSVPVGYSGNFSVDAPIVLVDKHRQMGYIPAKCQKGNLTEEIKIKI